MKKRCRVERCSEGGVAPELESAQEELLSLLSAWSRGETWRPSPTADLDILWLLVDLHALGGVVGAVGEPEQCGTMLKAARETYISNLLSHRRCLDVCQKLQRHAYSLNIPLAFFGGPVLAEEAYADAGLRPYPVMDVVVGSQENASLLIKTCELSPDDNTSGWSRRIRAPGRLLADAEGAQILFRYPLPYPCDPLFDLLQRHGNRILRVPREEGPLAAPDPELHFLMLLQHMAGHLCERLLWFVDLVALWRRYRNEIDAGFLLAELDILQCRNIAAKISHFCSNMIDSEFPLLPEGPHGWNSSFQNEITSPRYLSESFLVKLGALEQRARLLPVTRYFLITDPKEQGHGGRPAAARWLAARTVHAIGSDSEPLRRFLEWLLRFTGPILGTTSIAWIRGAVPRTVELK